MKKDHKILLKSLFISSLAALGTTPTSSVAATIAAMSKKDNDSDSEYHTMSEQLSSGELANPSDMYLAAHGSHGSHSSHSSHASHSSSSGSSSSGGGGGGGGQALIVTGSILGGAAVITGLIFLIRYLTKDKYYSLRNVNNYNHGLPMWDDGSRSYELALGPTPTRSFGPNADSYMDNSLLNPKKNSYYGIRDLNKHSLGYDVEEMIDTLVSYGVLLPKDIRYDKQSSFRKYNKAVRKSVKQMKRRMGVNISANADKIFLKDLKDWKRKQLQWANDIRNNVIDLRNNEDALRAIAPLLVEKGYLKQYDASTIMEEETVETILASYHSFLTDVKLPECDIIDLNSLAILFNKKSVN